MTGGARDLDDVVRAFTESQRSVTLKRLRSATRKIAGMDFPDLFDGLPK
ncbi:MAG: hypothetical protein ACKVIW_05590 [bacterium]